MIEHVNTEMVKLLITNFAKQVTNILRCFPTSISKLQALYNVVVTVDVNVCIMLVHMIIGALIGCGLPGP